MSGMFITYQFLAFNPDFAECFAHFPAYYVGLLMAIADGIQGTS
jgi:hypothetical protein